MPGFRYCKWCNGKGCMCCEAEQKAWSQKAASSAPSWRQPDVRDLRSQALKDETKRLESLIGVSISSQEEFNRLEAEAHAKIEEMFRPELDAEYARQFPGGPQPIFTVNRSSDPEMAELKNVFGRDALERAFGQGGRGIEEILENCEAATKRLAEVKGDQ